MDEVFANFFWLVNMLIKDDFPTFERPINANSGFPSVGQSLWSLLLTTNVADLIFMVKFLAKLRINFVVANGDLSLLPFLLGKKQRNHHRQKQNTCHHNQRMRGTDVEER